MLQSAAESQAGSAVGAYGFVIRGLVSPGLSVGLVPVPSEARWPCVHLTWRLGTSRRPDQTVLGEDEAVMLLVNGEYASIDRRRGTALIHAASPIDDHDLVHPYLAAPAAIMAQWHGRLALHAGGLVVDGAAWALLGEKEAGKSTTLAACATRGLPVLADDLVIVEGEIVFAGPRSLDLRWETAERLGAGEALLTVRDGERARLRLPPVAAQLPFSGCVVLEEGESVQMSPVPLAERLPLLSKHLLMSHHTQRRLLDLLALPMWSLRRPKNWDVLPGAVDTLVDRIA